MSDIADSKIDIFNLIMKQGMNEIMDKTKILIIEDDEAIADLLSYGLTQEGFQTCTESNGALGMKQLDQFKPDLLLLDWMLPDCSGLDICKKVTQRYNIPILMITAKSDITDKVLGLEFGLTIILQSHLTCVKLSPEFVQYSGVLNKLTT